jgi:predicted ATPase/class 3 adenylate cyclase
MSTLPTGTVTFLFTDIEGSTKLAQEHPDTWESLRKRHHAILKSAIESHNGYVFQIIGDAFCAAFHTAGDALRAAVKSQIDLHAENWGDAIIKVRIGIHTGKAEIQEDGEYHGYLAMSRVQRLMSAAHGGQVLISLSTEELIRDELPESASLRDMGERRLKDLIRPEHIYQLVIPNLPVDFPPLKTLDAHRHNLPAQTTSFIGREKEMAEIKQALEKHRLVTLTGSGGTGKTRLSLQVAAGLVEQYPDGVWFIELAPLTDPDLIPQTMLSVLGVSKQQGKSALQSLTDHVHDKKLLFILDNCEHLIEACAKIADILLSDSQVLKILASSREALGVKGEMAWHVPSLSLPDIKQLPTIEQLSQYEAVRLFIERASLAQQHFTVTKDNAPAIAQICFRLDGIPLAIELAAARVKVLKAEQIAERLNDRFRLLTGGSRTALPRQQTLRALIDWSYDLLVENEKLLLRRLAVFTGGWTLELAEQVCSDEKTDSVEILDMLVRLVDKSLVSMTEGSFEARYRMLETVRQYAREKLFESGEGEKARDQHLLAFIELAEKAEPEIRSFNQLVWLDRLDEEIDNLRAALEWSQERDNESFLRLESALWRFWDVRGHTADFEWLPKALTATEGLQTVLRARALGRAAYVAANHGDPQRGRIWAKEAEILSRALDDKPGLAMALGMQGNFETDYAQGRVLLDHALILVREIGDHWASGGILNSRAGLFLNQNDLTSAESYFEQALKDARISGDMRRISFGLMGLGQTALGQGDALQAEKWFREALAAAQEIRDNPNIFGSHSFITFSKLYLEDYASAKELIAEDFRLAQIDKAYISQTFLFSAWIDLAQGNLSGAIEQMEEGLLLAKQTTDLYSITTLITGLGDALRRIGDFEQARIKYEEAIAVCQKENIVYGYCVCFEGWGMLAIDQGQAIKGVHLFGMRERLRASEFVMDFLPFMVREREAHIAAARAQLGEDAFNQAWAEGKAMSTEESVKYALEEII